MRTHGDFLRHEHTLHKAVTCQAHTVPGIFKAIEVLAYIITFTIRLRQRWAAPVRLRRDSPCTWRRELSMQPSLTPTIRHLLDRSSNSTPTTPTGNRSSGTTSLTCCNDVPQEKRIFAIQLSTSRNTLTMAVSRPYNAWHSS